MASPIVGILLAAGSGSRFGGDKLLHPLADGTPIAVAAARSLATACERTLAVLRPGSAALAALLAAAGCEIVICDEASLGMGHSLATGVRAAPAAAGWLIALADMPFIQPTSHHSVVAALRAGAALAAPSYQGRRGHPVGFAASWYESLIALRGDSGARALLAAAADPITLRAVDDPGVLRDVDRPTDLDPTDHPKT
ncbi:MAG TPA: nucleotidyltransferase family protein [Rhodocyclaceae bacterium]